MLEIAIFHSAERGHFAHFCKMSTSKADVKKSLLAHKLKPLFQCFLSEVWTLKQPVVLAARWAFYPGCSGRRRLLGFSIRAE